MTEPKTAFSTPARDERPLEERVLDCVDLDPGLTITKMMQYLKMPGSRSKIVMVVTNLVATGAIVRLNPDPTSRSQEDRYARHKDAQDMIIRGEAMRAEDWKAETAKPKVTGFTPPAAPAKPGPVFFTGGVLKPPDSIPALAKPKQAVSLLADVDAPRAPVGTSKPVTVVVVSPAQVLKTIEEVATEKSARLARIVADLRANPGTESRPCAMRLDLHPQRVSLDLGELRDKGVVRGELIPKRGRVFAWYVIEVDAAPVEHGLASIVRDLKPVAPPPQSPSSQSVSMMPDEAPGNLPCVPVFIPETSPEVAVAVGVEAPVQAVPVADPVVEASPVEAFAAKLVRDGLPTPAEPVVAVGVDGAQLEADLRRPPRPEPTRPCEPDPRAMIENATEQLVEDMVRDGWMALRLLGGERGMRNAKRALLMTEALILLERFRES